MRVLNPFRDLQSAKTYLPSFKQSLTKKDFFCSTCFFETTNRKILFLK